MKMMRLKMVPDKTNINFLGLRKITVTASIAAMVASVILFFAMGLNFGIDFRGGTMIEIRTVEATDIGHIRSVAGSLGLGDVAVQEFGAATDVLIRIERQPGGGDEQVTAVESVKAALLADDPSVQIRRIEIVGPKVSGELVEAGIIAIVLAVLATMVYIWLRFEWQFSVGAVAALIHDVTLTIGIFALLQLEFNLSIIAAILTIVGYSLNDTVVVFDRVRENLRKYKTKLLEDVLNLSINETLSRTVMTSVTTLIALIALVVFGPEVIYGFTFAMIWGVIIGTYSSVFIASPILLRLGVKRDWSKTDSGGPTVDGVQFGSTDAP